MNYGRTFRCWCILILRSCMMLHTVDYSVTEILGHRISLIFEGQHIRKR